MKTHFKAKSVGNGLFKWVLDYIHLCHYSFFNRSLKMSPIPICICSPIHGDSMHFQKWSVPAQKSKFIMTMRFWSFKSIQERSRAINNVQEHSGKFDSIHERWREFKNVWEHSSTYVQNHSRTFSSVRHFSWTLEIIQVLIPERSRISKTFSDDSITLLPNAGDFVMAISCNPRKEHADSPNSKNSWKRRP